MNVIFQHKNGREQFMQERFAKILQSLGRGTYMTRDMQAVERAFLGPPATSSIQELDAEIKAANAVIQDEPVSPAELKSSKAARALAESAGVDISKVAGTGNDGAITKPDVEAFIAAQAKTQE